MFRRRGPNNKGVDRNSESKHSVKTESKNLKKVYG